MKGRTYKEIAATALGWWLFLTVNLLMGLAVVTVVQTVRVDLDWRLAIPVLLKWEFIVLTFSVFVAIILHFYKNVVMRVLSFGGFLRTFIIYFLSYIGVVIVLPYLPYGRILVIDIESNLALVLLLLVIVRVIPQKYFKDPDGPTLSVPVDDVLASEIKSLGIFQSGLDFKREYSTPVYAAANGKVKMTWPYKGDGTTVKIQHEDRFSTLYAHLSEVEVDLGQEVKRGDLIGYVGNTGHSFEPHLHFEVRYRDRVVDPHSYLSTVTKKSKESKQGNGHGKKKSNKKKRKG